MATCVGKARVVGPALDYSYGWLCYVEWCYFEDQEQPNSEWSQKFHRGMQHYLFA